MLLPGGVTISLDGARPVTEGWSNRVSPNPRLLRCRTDDGRTVIVKMRRPPGDPRRAGGFHREMSALLLLAELGCDAGPRLLATDDSAGLLVLEDLGDGPALEDLLLGDDPHAATAAFEAHAAAIGRMHAATLGQAGALGPSRHSLRGHPEMPAIGDVLEVLGSGPMALSNGDPAPQNGRYSGGRVRLLDFEDAACQHPLLDAAHLRLPFYGGPCWARVPAEVGARVEAAYRTAAGRADDRAYAEGMAAAVAAWTIIRLVRLPKLIAADVPHPMGFSRRGQLLDTLRVGADATDGVFEPLSRWFGAVESELRERWPGLPPSQECYPAYRKVASLPVCP